MRHNDEIVIERITADNADVYGLAVRRFRQRPPRDDFLADPSAVGFVALSGDDVVGWCWGHRLRRPDDAPMLYLHDLRVADDEQGHGVGRRLIEAFVAHGRRIGATKMFLSTGADNAIARRLYESLGGGLAPEGPTVNYWFVLDSDAL